MSTTSRHKKRSGAMLKKIHEKISRGISMIQLLYTHRVLGNQQRCSPMRNGEVGNVVFFSFGSALHCKTNDRKADDRKAVERGSLHFM
jgi:hypothetical protein